MYIKKPEAKLRVFLYIFLLVILKHCHSERDAESHKLWFYFLSSLVVHLSHYRNIKLQIISLDFLRFKVSEIQNVSITSNR